jgi:hypothetical protein
MMAEIVTIINLFYFAGYAFRLNASAHRCIISAFFRFGGSCGEIRRTTKAASRYMSPRN